MEFNSRAISMRRASKIDENQPEIVLALRKIGASVQILSAVGDGCVDILVGHVGKNYCLEIKDGNKPPSAQKLTDDQVKWHNEWRGQKAVVNSVKQAFLAIGINWSDES